MKPSCRLYNCMLCHKQTIICSYCDRGQIYCSLNCAFNARKQSQKLAAIRYQNTFRGKILHAARQAKYRQKQKIVTHQGSLALSQYAQMNLHKNKTEEIKNQHDAVPFVCCVCQKPVSNWLRHSFLRGRKNSIQKPYPQAP